MNLIKYCQLKGKVLQFLPCVGELILESIGLLQEAIDGLKGLFTILFTLDRFNGAARFRGEGQLKFGILAEAASVA